MLHMWMSGCLAGAFNGSGIQDLAVLGDLARRWGICQVYHAPAKSPSWLTTSSDEPRGLESIAFQSTAPEPRQQTDFLCIPQRATMQLPTPPTEAPTEALELGTNPGKPAVGSSARA